MARRNKFSYVSEISVIKMETEFADMFRGVFDVRGRGKSYSKKKYFAVKLPYDLTTREFIAILRNTADSIESIIK